MSMKLKKKVKELTGDDATQATQIAALQTAVGDNTVGEETGIYKDIADINAAIGDEDTAASILGRIKALEDAQPSGTQ